MYVCMYVCMGIQEGVMLQNIHFQKYEGREKERHAF